MKVLIIGSGVIGTVARLPGELIDATDQLVGSEWFEKQVEIGARHRTADQPVVVVTRHEQHLQRGA
jgi:hypothetical protein